MLFIIFQSVFLGMPVPLGWCYYNCETLHICKTFYIYKCICNIYNNFAYVFTEFAYVFIDVLYVIHTCITYVIYTYYMFYMYEISHVNI